MTDGRKEIKRIVVKVGSSLFFSSDGKFDSWLFTNFVNDITGLQDSGVEVVIVSSGAIALGMKALRLETRPSDLSMLQSASAIGQNILMDKYRDAFGKKQIEAQILLTWEDFSNRGRYLNARSTLLRLLGLRVTPIVNENDTVATQEIRFGDNDRLSALVAAMIKADLLIILTDVAGLLDGQKSLCRSVTSITPEVRRWACPSGKQTSAGGMITKLEAAKICVDSEIPCVIASGRTQGNLEAIRKDPFAGGEWTVFVPQKQLKVKKDLAYKCWIAASKPKGAVLVDDGARKALLNKKSLLSVGVTGVQGRFEAGDIVAIADASGKKVGMGRTAFGSVILDKIKGKRHEREIVHRDNIVITG